MIYYSDNEIIIRDIREDDVRDLFMCWIDKDLNKYDPRPMPTTSKELLDECFNYCRRFESEVINKNVADRKYIYFIVTDHSGTFLGYANCFDINKEKKQCEIGITIGNKKYLRKGIATKAIIVAVNYLYNNMNLNRVYIETEEDNVPAINLFDKLGFKRTGEVVEDDGFKFVVMDKLKSI